MNKLYAIYKLSSDLDGLPDNVLSLCADCADRPTSRTRIELDDTTADCDHCRRD